MSTALPVAWLFNFDAERELASPTGYAPPPLALRERFARLEDAVAPLLGPGDVLVRPDARGGVPRLARPVHAAGRAAFVGRAWCPTAWALDALARAGAEPPRAPSMAVLRRVNHRAFCGELGQTLPGGAFLRGEAAVLAHLAAPSFAGGDWLLKRPYGFAGRGRLKVAPGIQGAHERRWIEASLRAGDGLQVEPWLERTLDVALHGHIDDGGAIRLGRPTVQVCDRTGAWTASRLAMADDLVSAEVEALVTATREAAEALVAASYFGPFGVDGYRFLDGHGRPAFQPRSEINARYSMGWSAGLGHAPCPSHPPRPSIASST